MLNGIYERRKLKTDIKTAKINMPVRTPVLLFIKAMQGKIFPLKKLTKKVTSNKSKKIIKIPSNEDLISARLNCMCETMQRERYKKSQNKGSCILSLLTTDKKIIFPVF